jgi:transposase
MELEISEWSRSVTETIWVACVTGVCTVASGGLGVFLTNRHTSRQAGAARLEARQRDARALLADLLYSVNRWIDSFEGFAPALYKMTASATEMMNWNKTDSGRIMLEDSATIARAVIELRLVIDDKKLCQALERAERIRNDSSARAAFLREAQRTNGQIPAEGSVAGELFRHLRELRAAYGEVEARGVELFSVAI